MLGVSYFSGVAFSVLEVLGLSARIFLGYLGDTGLFLGSLYYVPFSRKCFFCFSSIGIFTHPDVILLCDMYYFASI